ncbi:hypothetical protein [Actinocrinis puniceicyclus]|nr:hypothetical protein [Actinocrinis puniceicyclus]
MGIKRALISAVAIALAAVALVTVGNANHSQSQTVVPNGGKAFDA